MSASSSERLVKVAIVGDGAMAGVHARVLAEIGNPLSVVVGAKPDKASQFAKEHLVPAWSTDADLVTGDPEIAAIIVASPNQFHVTQSQAALRSGKHVLCEVPLATSLQDARELANSAEMASTGCMVAQTSRFLPAITELHRRVVTGRCRPLQLFGVTGLLRRGHENIGMEGEPRDWLDSIIWHHGSHAIDTALLLLNDEVTLVRANGCQPDPINGRPVDVSLTLETTRGLLATLVLSYSCRTPISELTLVAEESTYRIVDMVGLAALESPDRLTPQQAMLGAVMQQDARFLRTVSGGGKHEPGPVDLLATCRVLDEVERQVTGHQSAVAVTNTRDARPWWS